jgi:DNA-binding beta-propeller fold protein YncE
MTLRTLLLASILAAGAIGMAHAELVIVGSDGHQPPEPGEQPGRVADTATVVDFSNGAVRVLGSVPAPASIIGPPMQIAVAPNERWALVAASTKGDPADMTKTLPDGTDSVIDLSAPARPRVVQTIQAGIGTYGIAINKAGNLVLAANNGDDTVTVFTAAANGTLTPAGKVQLPEGSRPNSVGFFPDGRSAFVMTSGPGGLQRLAVNGNTVTLAGPIANVGGTIALLTADGRLAITNAALRPAAPPAPPPAGAGAPAGGPPAGGRGGRGPGAPPTASLIDVATGNAVATAPLGAGPESIALSPDGTLLAAVITNGSHSPRTSPAFNDFGLLRLYRVTPTSLTQVAEAQTGHWCQNALFSRDNRTVLMNCSLDKEVQVYRYDGNATLTRDAASLKFEPRPAGMSSVSSR